MKFAFDFDDTLVGYEERGKKCVYVINKPLLNFLIRLLKKKQQVFIVTARCPAISEENYSKSKYKCKTKHSSEAVAFMEAVREFGLPLVEDYVRKLIPEEFWDKILIVYTDEGLKGSVLADLHIDFLIDDNIEQRADAESFSVKAYDPSDFSYISKILKEIGVF